MWSSVWHRYRPWPIARYSPNRCIIPPLLSSLPPSPRLNFICHSSNSPPTYVHHQPIPPSLTQIFSVFCQSTQPHPFLLFCFLRQITIATSTTTATTFPTKAQSKKSRLLRFCLLHSVIYPRYFKPPSVSLGVA